MRKTRQPASLWPDRSRVLLKERESRFRIWMRSLLLSWRRTLILVASPLVVYDRVEVFSAAAVEREP